MDLMVILKTLFGGETLTFEQFAEKVNNAADVKLGNLAGGQYVEKDNYDDVSNQLASANANLEGYDPDWQDKVKQAQTGLCLLYTSPSPRDKRQSRMPSSA